MAPRRQTRFVYAHRFRVLRVASLIGVGLLIWLVLNLGSLNAFFAAYQERNRERDSVEELRLTVAELKSQRQSLRLGTFEKEKSVRETFRLVRPGEELILLIPDEATTSDSEKSR